MKLFISCVIVGVSNLLWLSPVSATKLKPIKVEAEKTYDPYIEGFKETLNCSVSPRYGIEV